MASKALANGHTIRVDTLIGTRPDSARCRHRHPGPARTRTPAVQVSGELTLSTGFYTVRDLETPRARQPVAAVAVETGLKIGRADIRVMRKKR